MVRVTIRATLRVTLLATGVPAARSPHAVLAQAPAAAESTVSADGARLAHASYGPAGGPVVLLVAGTGMQLVDLPPALVGALVKRGYGVVAYDHRDVGRSSKLTAAGLPDTAAIAAALRAGKPAPLAYRLRDLARDGTVTLQG